MNKKNKILVGCLALLLALSVGYALFSETITINGTATAKGSFELTTTCQKGISNDVISYIGGDTTSETFQGGYSNDSCNVTNQRVDINVDLKMPGAARFFTINVENTGTIDAAIPISINNATDYNQTIKVYNSNDDSLYTTIKKSDSDFYDKARLLGHFNEFGEGSEIYAKNSDGVLYVYSDVDEAGMTMKDTTTGVSYLRIKPGESVIFLVLASWSEYYDDASKYAVATFSNEFPFTQVTSNMVETSDVTIRY